jgi:hypothetical protein
MAPQEIYVMIFRDAIWCNLIESCQYFIGTFCLNLQGGTCKIAKNAFRKSYTWRFVIAGNKPNEINGGVQVCSMIVICIFT